MSSRRISDSGKIGQDRIFCTKHICIESAKKKYLGKCYNDGLQTLSHLFFYKYNVNDDI